MKKALLLLLILPLLWGLGCSKDDKTATKDNQNDQEQVVVEPKDEFEILADNCRPEYLDCCLESVEFLKTSGYEFPNEMGCPPGYQIGELDCEGGYGWCEPTK